MENVAIFGGTFNPVHRGHLLIAQMAVSQFNLDRVFWVPTYCPPHKHQALTGFEHRMEMVRQAIAGNPSFTASDVDARRSGPSYAIDTFHCLRALQSPQLPDSRAQFQWHWIMGQDAFATLPRWRGIEALAAHCIWLVAPRSSTDSAARSAALEPTLVLTEPSTGLLRYDFIDVPSVGISSSLVRAYCQQQRSIRYLVPELVRHYIQAHRLFQSGLKCDF